MIYFNEVIEIFCNRAESCIPERERVHQALVDLIERNVPYNLEFEIITKGTRWLLLTAQEKLVDDKSELQRLERALEINKPLATAYYMKEDQKQLWNWHGDKAAAEWYLKSWIDMARCSGISMLEKFANILKKHFEGVLNYFDFDGLSLGPIEGTNNKIKTMQRMAYGYRDIDFFKLKIMALHETKYALVG